jgi:hypothetical protein
LDVPAEQGWDPGADTAEQSPEWFEQAAVPESGSRSPAAGREKTERALEAPEPAQAGGGGPLGAAEVDSERRGEEVPLHIGGSQRSVQPPATALAGPRPAPLTRSWRARLMPLVYGLAGAAVASAVFLMLGRDPNSKQAPAPPPAPEAMETSGTAAGQPEPLAEREQHAEQPLESVATGEAAGKDDGEPGARGAVGEGAPEPERSTPRPATRPASAALEAGREVVEAAQPCLSEQRPRRLRVSVYMQPEGKVVRAFVARTPGVDGALITCLRRELRGLELPLNLPKPGYVEWQLVFAERGIGVNVVRPRHLR